MSDLAARLARLGVGAPAGPAGLPLAERIARLRVRAATIPAQRPSDESLARALGGRVVAPALLEVVCSFPLPLGRGATCIGSAAALAEGVRMSAPEDGPSDAERLLFLDTETSGLAGGTGTTAFLVGLASVRDETLIVRQLLMTGFTGERALLEQTIAAVTGAHRLITFNGKSFDLPLLRARARLAGLDWRDEPPHLDLLHVTRRRLREGWPDCRLRTAEANALGFERVGDLPGSEVPAAWQHWLQRGDSTALPKVRDHNRDDLRSLAGLLAVLAQPTRREAPLLHALPA